MSDEIERCELTHKYPGYPLGSFLLDIDNTGGWPIGFKYVSFHHSNKRSCMFGNVPLRTEWWTTICSADDYYWWKISEAKKKLIAHDVERSFWMRIRPREVSNG
jgi:hypothetical protein